MAKIQLSVSQLQSQASEMDALKNEYEGLFHSVSSTLKTVNSNWSEILSNNFAGKITSAQKSFSEVVNMLEYGASAARTSADTFASIDSSIAAKLGGNESIAESKDKIAGSTKGFDPIGSVWKSITRSYNNKEAAYQLVQYGKAVVQIGLGACKVAAAVAAPTPTNILSAISGLNDVYGATADIIYTYYGEYEKVGTTNYLKDTLMNGYGGIGEALGDRQLGEKVGEYAYVGISAVSFLKAAEGLIKNFGILDAHLDLEGIRDSFVFGHRDLAEVIEETEGNVVKDILGFAGDKYTTKLRIADAVLNADPMKFFDSGIPKFISKTSKFIDEYVSAIIK